MKKQILTAMLFFSTHYSGIRWQCHDNGTDFVISGKKVAQINKEMSLHDINTTDTILFLRSIVCAILEQSEFFRIAGSDFRLRKMRSADGAKALASEFNLQFFGVYYNEEKYRISRVQQSRGCSQWKFLDTEVNPDNLDIEPIQDHVIMKSKITIYPNFFSCLPYSECDKKCPWLFQRFTGQHDVAINNAIKTLQEKSILFYILLITDLDDLHSAINYSRVINLSMRNAILPVFKMRLKELQAQRIPHQYVLTEEDNQPTGGSQGSNQIVSSETTLLDNLQHTQQSAEYNILMLINPILIIYYILSFTYPSILLISQPKALFILYNIVMFEFLKRLIFKKLPYKEIIKKLKTDHIIIVGLIIILITNHFISYGLNIDTFAEYLMSQSFYFQNVSRALLVVIVGFYCASYLLFIFLSRVMNLMDSMFMVIWQIMIFRINGRMMLILNIVRMIQYFVFIDCLAYFNEDLYYKMSSEAYNARYINDNKRKELYELGGKTVFYLQLLFVFCKYIILSHYISFWTLIFIIDDIPMLFSVYKSIPLFICYQDILDLYLILLLLCVKNEYKGFAEKMFLSIVSVFKHLFSLYEEPKNSSDSSEARRRRSTHLALNV